MILNMTLPGGADAKAEFAYTGAYTQKQITSGGVTYDLYTLTGSGTLTVTGTAKNVDIWLCGGGSMGMTGSAGCGGAGAYCGEIDGQTLSGEYAVSVGSAAGKSIFGDLLSVNAVSGKSGGTGGGYNVNGGSGTGDGKSKYPFGDTVNFDPHCAAGGGGGYDDGTLYNRHQGGQGGTNGGNGSAANPSSDSVAGGPGGNKGGGTGGHGSNSSVTGTAATFYGSGGGGSGYAAQWKSGAGYQGVVYIRVPV